MLVIWVNMKENNNIVLWANISTESLGLVANLVLVYSF